MTKYMQIQDPTLERSFRGHKDVVTGLSFKPSMTQLASSSLDHSVMIWNFKPQLRAFRFVGHKAPVTNVDFSPTGTLLASSSRDATVRLWTPNVKGDVTVFKAHTSTVRNVQFSRDGEALLTCSDDKTIKIWATPRTKFQFTLAGHLNWVRTARYSPDSRLIASGSDDKTVKLWDLASKSCVKTFWDHTGMVTSVAFHPSGTIIASASTDRSIKLFDIRMNKLLQHYGDAHGVSGNSVVNGESPIGGVNSISFGGLAGEWLISTGMDGVIKIWDLKEGHLFYTLHGHKQGPTTSAVFSNDGVYFATGGSDSQVMVWKSNFDELVKQGEDIVQTRLPHGQSDFPHQEHPINTEVSSIVSEAMRNQPSILSQPAIKNGPSGLKTVRKDIDGENNYRKDFQKPSNPTGKSEIIPENIKKTQAEIPNEVTNSLQHIIRQMDILTQTMSILESRLTMNEDRVVEMGNQFKAGFKNIESVLQKQSEKTFDATLEGFPQETRPISSLSQSNYVDHSFAGIPIPKTNGRNPEQAKDTSGLIMTTEEGEENMIMLGS